MPRRKSDPARRGWPFFAFATLVGLGTLIPFALQAFRDVRIRWFYEETTCNVVSSRTWTSVTRFSGNETRTAGHPEFTYQLNVDGQWYTAIGFDNMGGRTAHPGETLHFRNGQTYPCWYDPWNPEEAVLKKETYPPFYLGLAIPGAFLLIGGSMLLRALRPVAPVKGGRTRAGEALPVRLEPEMSAGHAAGCLAIAVFVFTAIALTFFAYLGKSGRLFDGGGLTTLALGAAAIDVFLIHHFIRTLRGMAVPEPMVEIDRESLRPGDRTRVFVRQSGPARFASFRVLLVCEEEGGDSGRLHEAVLLERQGLAGELMETMNIEIPQDATLSRKELQSIVTWKIVVQRSGGPDREFVFRVVDSQ